MITGAKKLPVYYTSADFYVEDILDFTCDKDLQLLLVIKETVQRYECPIDGDIIEIHLN